MKLGLVFALLALGLILPNAYATTASIDVNGNTHEITYEATGLDVDGLEADTESTTLSVFVTMTDVEGILQITLDRNFFDSKTSEGADDEFLVLIDGGTEAVFTDDATESSRILTISVPASTFSIDIIGTVFGTGESAPAETSVEETPEIPIEEPTEQAPVEETPEVSQCGPGTVLKDGECVLDQTCGEGTVLQDGQCVLDTSVPAPTVSKGQGTQLAIGIVGAFVVAFIIMIVLWAIGKAGRSKN